MQKRKNANLEDKPWQTDRYGTDTKLTEAERNEEKREKRSEVCLSASSRSSSFLMFLYAATYLSSSLFRLPPILYATFFVSPKFSSFLFLHPPVEEILLAALHARNMSGA